MDGPYDQMPMPGMDPLHGQRFLVRKRDGRLDEFNEARIYLAMESAFKAVAGLGRDECLPDGAAAAVKHCAELVVSRVLSRAVKGEELEVESIQDAVEAQLMVAGHVEAARRYILYREERRQARALREGRLAPIAQPELPAPEKADANLYQRLSNFSLSINEGQYLKLLAPEMLDYDLDKLALHLRPERDELISRGGRQKLREAYFMKDGARVVEELQYFWMRIAMGLALNEGDEADARALEFYEVLSTLHFLPSEAILRGAGASRPELAMGSAASSVESIRQARSASGAACPWFELWHSAVLDSLRAPQNEEKLNKRFWIPDLFLRRVEEQDRWTLFDAAETSDLQELRGTAFEERYLHYEQMARKGKMQFFLMVEARALWGDIMESIREGGGAVIGFRDTVNLGGVPRAASDAGHGVSGAIHLPAFLTGEVGRPLDLWRLRASVSAGVRMLDNALELSLYPSPDKREAALADRVIGLGMHGFKEALERLRIDEATPEATEFSDRCAEALAWCAVLASAELASERGPCVGFAESKWSEGLMPPDTFAEAERGRFLDRSSLMDWDVARQAVLRTGMRHTSVTACVAAQAAEILIPPRPIHGTVNPARWIETAARRQKWIDMDQPFSFPIADATSEELGSWYLQAWRQGLKIVSAVSRTTKTDKRDTDFEALAK